MENKTTSEFTQSAILVIFYLLFIVSIFHLLSRHVITLKNTSRTATEVDCNMIFAWRLNLMPTYITRRWSEVVSTRQLYWLKPLVILMEGIYMCWRETDEVTEEWRSISGLQKQESRHSVAEGLWKVTVSQTNRDTLGWYSERRKRSPEC